jgi:peroxiredoxin
MVMRALFVLLLVPLLVRATPQEPLPDLGPAPAWRLKDPAGKEVSSTSLAGKVVVVDFWATWCAPCREEVPGYIDLQTRLGPKGVVVVGLSLDEDGAKAVAAFAKKHGVNYLLLMADDAVQKAFGGIESIPTTFLIDREGRIRHRKVGAMEAAEYAAVVERVL